MRHHITEVESRVAQLNAATDRTARAKALAELLKPYDPGGQWMYAPAAERKRAEQQMLRDQDTRAGQALYALRQYLFDHLFEVQAAIVAAREAPGPERASELRSGRKGGSQEACLLLGVLDELRRTRLGRELGQAPPSVVLAVYRGALADPDEQSNATTIKYVEAKHAAGWAGPASESEAEMAAALALRARITTTRDSRVPLELTEAEAAFDAASRVCATVEALGICAIKPEEG